MYSLPKKVIGVDPNSHDVIFQTAAPPLGYYNIDFMANGRSMAIDITANI